MKKSAAADLSHLTLTQRAKFKAAVAKAVREGAPVPKPPAAGAAKSLAPRAGRSKSPAPKKTAAAAATKKAAAASRSKSPARSVPHRRPAKAAAADAPLSIDTCKTDATGTGNNWVGGGVGDGTLFVPLLLVFAPIVCQLLVYLTSEQATAEGLDVTGGLGGIFAHCAGFQLDGYGYGPRNGTDVHGWGVGWGACAAKLGDVTVAAMTMAPTACAVKFLLCFAAVALVLDLCLPGKVEYGPETLTGHVPAYCNNGMLHCFLFSALFLAGSNFYAGLYDFGIFFDVFPAAITCLNLFGFALAGCLYYKGLRYPSTADCGSSGSFLKDFTWGTELYPRLLGGRLDIKRWVNCRFSMTVAGRI